MPGSPYSALPFNITPVSPPFDLSPIASNTSQGWVPSCSTPECVSTASWSTNSVGATLSFQFWGWDVAFDGNVKGNMSIELLRDGVKERWNPSGNTLFGLHNQPANESHLYNITIRVLDVSPDAELTVNQAHVNGSFGDFLVPVDHWTVPANNTRLNYSGFAQQAGTGAGRQAVFTSSRAGDTASMQFNASMFLLYGPCGPTNGLMKLTIDGQESTVNVSKRIASDDCLLLQSWLLQPSVMHRLLIENVDGATLGINRFEFYWVRHYKKEYGRSNAGEVALIVGVLVVCFLLLASLWLYLKKTAKGRKTREAFKLFCL
ncbi:unnamed protein product [Rhizoctonia solani]|uniref:Uncharacterized protein n=1 Tax=Rhizoctonia solani TaxID=456999 RepID=A0A8H2Y6A2_9AGAM|nr:unnamed protein product [Rhizoctonia solani]